MRRAQTKIPGYDCRTRCAHAVRGQHGQAQEKWYYTVVRDDGLIAISFTVGSGVYPDATYNREPDGRDLTLHIGYPQTVEELRRGQKAGQECSLVKSGRCYDAEMAFTTGLGADEFFKQHFSVAAGFEQPEAFWVAFEAKLASWLTDAKPDISQTHERCMHCDGLGTVRKP